MTLWAGVRPAIYLDFASRRPISQQLETFELFAARSGALPLTFSCGLSDLDDREIWSANKGKILEFLAVLVAHCRKWGTVDFTNIPPEALKCLSSVRGNVPLLKHLGITTFTKNIDIFPQTLDYSADSPALRSISMELCQDIPIVVPLSQLESINVKWTPRTMKMHTQLLQSESRHLRTFRVEEGSEEFCLATLSSPCTLPNLTSLDFSNFLGPINHMATSFVDHLQMLTLPSLTSPTLRWAKQSSLLDNLFTRLLGLITRSGCSLNKLEVGPPFPLSTSRSSSSTVFEILALSPRLRRLPAGYTDAAALRKLVLDPSAPRPMLPALEELTITLDGEDLYVYGGVDITWRDPALATALVDVIDSRRRQDSGARLRNLELDGDGIPAYVPRALAVWEREAFAHLMVDSPNLDEFPDAKLVEFISKAEDTFASYDYNSMWLPRSGPETWKTLVTPELLDVVGKFEEIDFEAINASLLARQHGIIYYLAAFRRKNWPVQSSTVEWDTTAQWDVC